MRRADQPATTRDRQVLPWRWVAGGLLHLAVVAYLLVVPLICLLLTPRGASTEAIARLAARLSLWFLAGLAAVALVVLPAVKLVDLAARARRRRRSLGGLSSAAAQSRNLVQNATSAALDADLAPILARIAAARWNHEKPGYQSLARDLDEVVRAASIALASAMAERRAGVAEKGVQALTRIADELDRLAAANAQVDEARVDILSNYLHARYPALDSPLMPD